MLLKRHPFCLREKFASIYHYAGFVNEVIRT